MPSSLLSTGALTATTGGTERRPLHRGEVAQSQEHRPADLKSTPLTPPGVSLERRAARRGEHSSRVCVPPCFLSIEVQHSATKGMGTRSPEASGNAATTDPACP